MKLAFSFLVALTYASNVLVGNDQNFKELVIKSSKISLVDFYADWCRHCQNLMPIIERLGEEFSPNAEVQVVKVNGDKEGRKVARKFDIKGYPTLMIFKGDSSPIDYEGARDQSSISNFLRLFLRNVSPLTVRESAVFVLQDQEISQYANPEKVIYALVQYEPHRSDDLSFLWREIPDLIAEEVVSKSEFLELHVSEENSAILSRLNLTEHPGIAILNNAGDMKTFQISNATKSSILSIVRDFALLNEPYERFSNTSSGRIESLDKSLDFSTATDGNSLLKRIRDLSESSRGGSNASTGCDTSMLPFYEKLVLKIMANEKSFLEAELKRLQEMLKKDSRQISCESLLYARKRINILRAALSTRTPERSTFVH